MAGPLSLRVSGCTHHEIQPPLDGIFRRTANSNHGLPIYRKTGQVNGADVLLYFWDERDDPAWSGWWFGPKVGGTINWGYHPQRGMGAPPTVGWRIPVTGPESKTFRVERCGPARKAPQQAQAQESRQQAQEAMEASKETLERVLAGLPRFQESLAGEPKKVREAEMKRKQQEESPAAKKPKKDDEEPRGDAPGVSSDKMKAAPASAVQAESENEPASEEAPPAEAAVEAKNLWRCRACGAHNKLSSGECSGTGCTQSLGLEVRDRCDLIRNQYCDGRGEEAEQELATWCQRATHAEAHELLQTSVFGLIPMEDLRGFIRSPDNLLWREIEERVKRFIQKLTADEDQGGPPMPLSDITQINPDGSASGNPELKKVIPWVMDQSVREPVTSTPFGHTSTMKHLTLKIVRAMGFKDIAITGMFYKDSYTPELQILEDLRHKGDSMAGLIAMFGPGQAERKAGVAAVKKFKIPNAFLDVTVKFDDYTRNDGVAKTVLDAVQELDGVFKEMDLPQKPWRSDASLKGGCAVPGAGEISLNFVNLMEFVELKPNGDMNAAKKQQAENIFAKLKSDEAFTRRVVAVLVEEGRGAATIDDFGNLVQWLREHFPFNEQYRIAVHAHAGDHNLQDAASIESVLKGANGVWAAVIPQAAIGGHNSSLVFLDNLVAHGNQNVLTAFNLHQAAECARHLYYLNFNTYTIPGDCPIWGGRVRKVMLSAFTMNQEWRKREKDIYDSWRPDQKFELNRRSETEKKLQEQVMDELKSNRNCVDDNAASFRISPLVSDLRVWHGRMSDDLMLFKRNAGTQDVPAMLVPEVRKMSFALMNANIRANIDRKPVLEKLLSIARTKDAWAETFPWSDEVKRHWEGRE